MEMTGYMGGGLTTFYIGAVHRTDREILTKQNDHNKRSVFLPVCILTIPNYAVKTSNLT
jgi:hypothetical protein